MRRVLFAAAAAWLAHSSGAAVLASTKAISRCPRRERPSMGIFCCFPRPRRKPSAWKRKKLR